MKRISLRDIVDISLLADGLEFKPITKKPLKYPLVAFNNLHPLTYAISKEKRNIETHTSDGKETTNTAEIGDLIFCGPSGEKYVLKPAKVERVYKGEVGGTLTAEQNPRQVSKYTGEEITFKAPWGESMVLKPNDYLVKEQDGSGYYRIAKKEFEETYADF